MSDKTQKLILRATVGLILLVTLLFMFVINPHVNDDPYSNETLWEAVHPYNALWDTLGLIGLIGFCLSLTGYLGQVFSFFTDVSKGAIQAIAIVCMILMVLFFV